MLGRTANGLFWMFRYLERAENTARLLDAGLRMALTRDLATSKEEWRSVIQTAGQKTAYEKKFDNYTGSQAWNFVLRDKENQGSVMQMLDSVRTNARLSRNAISSELWEAINESWMQIKEMLARPVTQATVGQVVAAVRRGGTLVHGAMAGSMLRSEGYHFARAGTFLERGESTARILDIKYYLLLPSFSYVGSTHDTGQWDTVLRSVSGDRGYRFLNAGQIDARGIVEFLLLDTRFPRSLAFCHAAVRENLQALAKIHGIEAQSHILMREADTRIADMNVDAVFEMGLHRFLIEFMNSNAAIAAAIADDYRFTA